MTKPVLQSGGTPPVSQSPQVAERSGRPNQLPVAAALFAGLGIGVAMGAAAMGLVLQQDGEILRRSQLLSRLHRMALRVVARLDPVPASDGDDAGNRAVQTQGAGVSVSDPALLQPIRPVLVQRLLVGAAS